MMLEIIVLISFSALLNTIGQIIYKKVLNRVDTHNYLPFLKIVLRSFNIWLGFFCIGLSIVIWLMALSKTELNIIYSLDSMSYILMPIAAMIFLGEKIDRNKIIGTIFIVFGIIIVAFS